MSYNTNDQRQKTLAWHETLELHELVAFQSIGLMKLKDAIGKVKEKELKELYRQTIRDLEANLNELMAFYKMAPRSEVDERRLDPVFYAGDLLAFAKTSVRNYAIAITETATPQLRNVFSKHLQKAIECHARVFNYMYKHGYYPSYDFEKLLANDVTLARKALSMKY
ncbi:spore coat protein [Bacillus sinesaloumensis]|uniref:spore coat protein n=1 Tax=Litchfieldia sinesaloumensis TaxID=1926280 RepID=UPI0009887A52|nr:spore coat protein [Bacillus sinesaloumensis]